MPADMQQKCKVCARTAPRRCSACKSTFYCSTACQKGHWAQHKPVCKWQRFLDAATQRPADAPKARSKKAILGPDGRPVDTHCTGCNIAFTPAYGRHSRCADCGYAACESCACHHERGACWCSDSNFGQAYCGRVPEYFEGNGKSMAPYQGDRHPDNRSKTYPDAAYEETAKTCGNCGQSKRMLRAQYC